MSFLEGDQYDDRIYRQCELSKRNGTGVLRHQAYIPSDKAKVGKYLKLPEPYGNGWRVDSIGPARTMNALNSDRDNRKRWEWVLGK